jgi:hypothetical protein
MYLHAWALVPTVRDIYPWSPVGTGDMARGTWRHGECRLGHSCVLHQGALILRARWDINMRRANAVESTSERVNSRRPWDLRHHAVLRRASGGAPRGWSHGCGTGNDLPIRGKRRSSYGQSPRRIGRTANKRYLIAKSKKGAPSLKHSLGPSRQFLHQHSLSPTE